jgi:adenylylsulfate kinase
MIKILIMGLPGAGKTTLAQALRKCLEDIGNKVIWINADQIREEYNDWDFSHDGRIRQSYRMKELANRVECNYTICDFIAPLEEMRRIFSADFTIWVDTIKEGIYNDTNKIFVAPDKYDVHVTEQNSDKWSKIILKKLHDLKLIQAHDN